jgi:signal transduction histidine kinase/ligand-binding sensor domain-containing protein
METPEILKIKKIDEDDLGNIWVAATQGMLKIEPTGAKTFYPVSDTLLSKRKTLETVYIASDGIFYVGFWAANFLTFDPSVGVFEYVDPGEYAKILDEISVMSIDMDSEGNLWMGTYQIGLIKLVMDGNRITDLTVFSHNPENENSINSNKIKKVSVTPDDKLWIGTEEGGLNFFDPVSKQFTHYLSPFRSAKNPEGESVYDIVFDGEEKLWLGSRDNGLYYVNVGVNPFQHISSVSNGKLDENERLTITALYEDAIGRIWAGYSSDLALVDLERNILISQNTGFSEIPNAIAGDNMENIWIGGLEGTISKYNPETGRLKNYEFKELKGVKILLFSFSDNKVFIGTDQLQGYIDLLTEEFYIINNPHLKGSYHVLKDDSFYIHIKRTLVNIFDRKIAEDPFFRPVAEINYTFPNSKCAAVSPGYIYIGTDAGLFQVDKEDHNVEFIQKLPGPQSYSVRSLQLEDENAIWFSTANSLVRHIAQTDYFRIFDHFDGLPTIHFRDGVGLKTRDGNILMGGENGIVAFNPSNISFIKNTPVVEISNMEIGRKDDPESVIQNLAAPEVERTVKLKHNQNFFTINWTMPEYMQPQLVLYSWKLEGFDQNWNEAYGQYNTVYMNLPPGSYTFLVKGKDNENNWSEIQALNIKINPPIWLTWYAYIFYLVMAAFLLYRYRVYTLNRERLQNKLKMQRVRLKSIHKLVKKEQEVNEWKFRFFTNISHEFKTPLMLIVSPLEQAIEQGITLNENAMNQIYANAKKIHRMVTQMLDFRKMEAGKLHLQKTNDNIIPFIVRTCNYFREPVVKKKLGFSVLPKVASLYTSFDPDKIEKILYNLISNALKNTEHGSISIEIDRVKKDPSGNDADLLQIMVVDTGKGIPQEAMEHIFERFYQIPSKDRQDDGTGIGLCLTYELVKLHQGEIQVFSKLGEGSRFIVTIPVLQPETTEEKPTKTKMVIDKKPFKISFPGKKVKL